MYFSDPSKCTYCQNCGIFDCALVGGKCHRCEVRSIADAAYRANIRRENPTLFRDAAKVLWYLASDNRLQPN